MGLDKRLLGRTFLRRRMGLLILFLANIVFKHLFLPLSAIKGNVLSLRQKRRSLTKDKSMVATFCMGNLSVL